jgi:hypothetical protein
MGEMRRDLGFGFYPVGLNCYSKTKPNTITKSYYGGVE